MIVALAATFRQRPATVEVALDKIRAGSPISGSLFDALSTSGSESAQLALIAVLQSPGADREQRLAAAFALSRSKKPSVAAIQALTAQVDDGYVRVPQALYGLGYIVGS